MKIILILIFMHSSLWALQCSDMKEVGRYLNMTYEGFRKNYRDFKSNKNNKGEPVLEVDDFNQAQAIAYKLPFLKELELSSGLSRTPYEVTLGKSSLYGKNSGWKYNNINGDIANVRLDWDPIKGAHFNIEVTYKDKGKETSKLAIFFNCEGVPCTEKFVIDQVNKLKQTP